MVSVLDLIPGQGARLVVEPNNELSWQGNLGFLASLLGVLLFISLSLLLAGAWVVLPLVMLELLLLALVIYQVKLKLSQIEVISIADGQVRIEKGRRSPELCWVLPCAEVRVMVESLDDPFECSDVALVGEHGMILLGHQLSREECNALIEPLRECGLRVSSAQELVVLSA